MSHQFPYKLCVGEASGVIDDERLHSPSSTMSESVVSRSVMYLLGPGDLESITHNAITYMYESLYHCEDF